MNDRDETDVDITIAVERVFSSDRDRLLFALGYQVCLGRWARSQAELKKAIDSLQSSSSVTFDADKYLRGIDIDKIIAQIDEEIEEQA